LVAVVAYFWKDWLLLTKKGLTAARSREGRLFWCLVAASVPGAAAGLLLGKKAETIFRSPPLIACMLITMGIILYWADRKGSKRIGIDGVTLGTGIIIGLSQALAIIPGVSRSGITITSGLLMGLTREAAARFSFLMSTPIIFGAAIVKLPHVLLNPSMITTQFITGVLVSCAAGIASIGFLLRYLQTRNFVPFVWYRFILGTLVFMMVLIR
jgi:undecaprenyl-diphosphatase